MTLNNLKGTIASVWVLGIGAYGLIAGLSSSSWLLLAGVALLPPLAMMWYWTHPPQTLSQSIQKSLK